MGTDTVFSPAFGNRPSQLVGRSNLIETMLAALDSKPGSKERATVITGQRGYGKTVFLWELADKAREKGFIVVNPTAVRVGMVERIAEKLADEAELHLKSAKRKVTGGTVGALGFSAGISLEQQDRPQRTPEGRIEQIVRGLSKQDIGTLLLVDELQGNSAEVRTLVETYQELVGEGLNVAIVLAGLPGAVSATLNDHVLTFLNRAKKVNLPALAIGDVDAYYQSAFESCGIAIEKTIRKQAAQATQGSPYLMQLIGHYVVVYVGNEGLEDNGVLNEVLETARSEYFDDVCKTTLAGLSSKDVEYVRAMAGIGQDSPVNTAELARVLGVSADYAQQYRRRLIDAGIIEAAGHGLVRFCVPYIADYLYQNTD